MEPDPGNPELVAFIREQIAKHGPVTFRWFMQQALYHPQHGYYGSGKARIGRHGDFYTNVSVGRLFGELMAKQIEEMWKRLGRPAGFAVLEEGGHGGHFAQDVLGWMQRYSPDLYSEVKYWLVEPNPILRQEQQERLADLPRNKVRWCDGLASFEAGSLCGVHVSNELLDAFPVHLVTWTGDLWQENFVDLGASGFCFVLGPPSNNQLRTHLDTLPTDRFERARGAYQTEVNLAASRWIEDVASILSRGFVLAADYGYPRDVYYSAERTEGTLIGYRDQHKVFDPLLEVGNCDLTAHVDFTTLAERGEACGLRLNGYCDQHHFMVGLGEEELLKIEQSGLEMTLDLLHFLRTFKTLMHPATMGLAFKFLCMEKNAPPMEKPLAGFSRCGDPRNALGLGELPASLQSKLDDPYAAF
jgi:SAM-dependent MidA family methyltransferase